jgi:lactoylglutathione lyase
MNPIHDLFENHLTVSDLPRAMASYGEALGLEMARSFPERRVAFYWIGGRGTSMLACGKWEHRPSVRVYIWRSG